MLESTIGGDSNGDGPTDPAASSYGTGVFANAIGSEPGIHTVNLAHVAFRYGAAGIAASPGRCLPFAGCVGDSREGQMTVSDSSFTHMTDGISAESPISSVLSRLTVERSTFTDISSVAIATSVPVARLSDVHIDGAGQVLNALRGEVSLRGSVNAADGIRACNWSQNPACSVDATYVNWGRAAGPFPSAGAAQVCGNVIVAPWLWNGTTEDDNPWRSANCDGSSPPDQALQAAMAGAAARVDNLCAQGVCDVIALYSRCLSAARQLAIDNLPFPIDDGGVASSLGSAVVDGSAVYLKQSASPVVSDLGAVAGRATQVLNVVNIIFSLIQAYNSCP